MMSERVSKNINVLHGESLEVGDRLADSLAKFAGSWTFIAIFSAFIIAWMVVNTLAAFARPFDPYPFILLNLMLSCLAAVQAPIILMSQNRQEQRDRLRAENDYEVNVKAEGEIEKLHEKIDCLLEMIKGADIAALQAKAD